MRRVVPVSFLIIVLLIAFAYVADSFAQPLGGTKTIGGTSPDYATFSAATTALSTNGVNSGGVIFNVRPGVYIELVNVTPFTGMASTAPVIFRKDPNQTGAVTISPVTGSPYQGAITLNGCQYVTFDSINVIDANGVSNVGYRVTNYSTTQGAQHNWVKNATIQLQLSTPNSYGIYQYLNSDHMPTSPAGTQRDMHYINLKISNCQNGFYNYSFMPDSGLEIGSDSVGVNYAKRFVIGGDSMVGGPGLVYGIEIGMNTFGVNIHDIDICNLRSTSGPGQEPVYGIYHYDPNGSAQNTIANNRIYNLKTTYPSVFSNVYGIYVYNEYGATYPRYRIYNNMICNLASCATTAATTTSYHAYGMYIGCGHSDVVNNSVVIGDGGNANSRNYSSAAFYVGGGDSTYNNIFANLTPTGTTTTPHHVGYLFYSNTSRSNNNCYYIGDTSATGNGYTGGLPGAIYYHGLSAWQTASGGADQNSIAANPLFVSDTSDLHVTSTSLSPVAHRATYLPWVNTDIEGNARSVTAPTIGAYEIAGITTLELLRPNGGESLWGGSLDTIRWTPNLANGFASMQYNANYPSGTWTNVANNVNVASNFYVWTVPNEATTTARIAIIPDTARLADTSNSNFSIIFNSVPNFFGQIPLSFAIAQAYPNPFNNELHLTISIPTSGMLDVTVTDILGREVSHLYSGRADIGYVPLRLSANRLASGEYLVRAKFGQRVLIKKVMYLK